MTSSLSNDILSAALSGLEMQRQRLDEQIAEVRRMLGSSEHAAAAPQGAPARKKRSAAVRARMAAAQRKRWAAVRAARKVS